MRSCLKGITGVLKGTVVLLCLLYPDYTIAQCQCNLTYATRLTRDNETASYAQQYAQNSTLSQTDRLLAVTIPPFNLTAKLDAYIRGPKSTQDVPSIPVFIIKGGLYGINWTNFTAGYTGSNDSKIYRSVCNVTGCSPEWVPLPDYLIFEYYYPVIYQLRNLATWARYPLGAYRRDRSRYYNYSSYDTMLPPPKVCSCSSTGGYFYRIRFQIDPWNLTQAHYDNTTVTSKLLMTDLELAVDNFTSSTFNELYIQSNFEKWESVHSSVFFMILYFKFYYDANWTIYTSDIKAKLNGLNILKLEYLKTHLVVTIKPYAVACNWYEEGENGTVPRLTTVSSTLQTDTTSSGMLITTLGTEMSSTYSTSSTESSSSESPTIVPNTTTMDPSTSSNMESSVLTSSSLEITITSESFIATRTTLLSVVGDQYSQTNGSYSTVPIQSATNVSITGTSSTNNDVGTIANTFSTSTWNEITGNSTHFVNGTLKSLWDEIIGNSTHFANKTLRPTWNEMTGNATYFANGTQKLSNTLTTPFDEDPFFKAVVPVIKKVYNDEVLLKRGRNPLPITAQALLYTVAIPTTIGLCIAIVLLLAFCQIDCLGVTEPRKKVP